MISEPGTWLSFLTDRLPLLCLDLSFSFVAETSKDFLLELIPPGLTQLFFFDGEKIQRLAEEESESEELASSIKSLLGLDIVERLQSDLKIYSSKEEFWQKEDPLHQELQKLNFEINEC